MCNNTYFNNNCLWNGTTPSDNDVERCDKKMSKTDRPSKLGRSKIVRVIPGALYDLIVLELGAKVRFGIAKIRENVLIDGVVCHNGDVLLPDYIVNDVLIMKDSNE